MSNNQNSKSLPPQVFQKKNLGYTLLEVLLYVTIFSIIGGFLVNVLVGTLRVQTGSQSARVVSEEGRFAVQTIQRLVKEASLIDMSTTTSESTLILRVPDLTNNRDFIHIYASGSKIYVAEGVIDDLGASSTCPSVSAPACILTQLTDDRVSVDGLSFRRHSNAPGFDTLQIDLTLSYSESTSGDEYTKDFRTAIGRVSAAVFDSSLLPNPGSSLNLGASSQKWTDGFFSGNLDVGGTLMADGNVTIGTNSLRVNVANDRVGIGTASPAKPLHVVGGEIYVATADEGILLKSSGGNCFEIRILDSGEIATSTETCP